MGVAMSDKYITYGPGGDIDPAKMEEHITYNEDVLSPNRELLRLLWTALQQREEIIIRAIEALRRPYPDGSAADCIYAAAEALRVLRRTEGTDG